MAGALLRTAAVLFFTPLAFFGLLNGLAHILVYHPHPYRANTLSSIPAGVAQLRFQVSTGEQTSFYLPPRSGAPLPTRVWVLFCGNGSLALDWLPLARRDQNTGDAFLLIDYPGYGKSKGWANIANTEAVTEGALVALAARLAVPPATLEPRLNTIGHSLGAAAALDLAIRHPRVSQIILLAPFTSLREEAARFIGGPLSHLLMENYDNRAALHYLAQRRPLPRVTIFHGLQDAMISPEMGRELATEYPTFVSFHGLPDATHDTIVAAAADDMLEMLSH